MTIVKRLGLVALLPLFIFALPQHNQESLPLCELQEKVAEGDHINVRVSGIYTSGLEMGVLENVACPDRSIWVELALSSDRNKKKLKRLMDGPGKAHVVFEGELYGPPVPDPKLPDAIRHAYHPGWGHMGAFKTKLVVHIIWDVSVPPAPKS
jgi:hypothetical protein